MKGIFKNKKLIIIILVVLVVIIACVCAMMFLDTDALFKKTEQAPVTTPVETVEKSPKEIAKENDYKAITQEIKIGESKENVISKLAPSEDKIGTNYVINPKYTRIDGADYLTTFIFNNDQLVAILHERVLDGTEKHNLSIEFQKLSVYIGGLYTLVDTRREWFSTELNYDVNAWNDAITKNNLELYADFENEETQEFVQLVVSGINYFDFLAHDRDSLSMGNMDIIYTSSVYKDDFMNFVSLVAND